LLAESANNIETTEDVEGTIDTNNLDDPPVDLDTDYDEELEMQKKKDKKMKKKQQKRAKQKKKQVPYILRSDDSEEENKSSNTEIETAKVADNSEEMKLTESINGMKMEEAPVPETPIMSEPSVKPKLKGKKLKEARKRAKEEKEQEDVGSDEDDAEVHSCQVCQSSFPSKNKLFKHIKSTGHAALKEGAAGGKKSKKKR